MVDFADALLAVEREHGVRPARVQAAAQERLQERPGVVRDIEEVAQPVERAAADGLGQGQCPGDAQEVHGRSVTTSQPAAVTWTARQSASPRSR